MNLPFIFHKRDLAGEDTKNACNQAKLEQPVRVGPAAYATDYMAIPSINRGVSFLADKVALLSLNHLSRQSDGLYAPSDSNLNYLLQTEPNQRMSSFDMWKAAVSNLIIHGEALVLPVKVDGTSIIKEFILVKPGAFQYNERDALYLVNLPEYGICDSFQESEVLHFVWHSNDGCRAYGLKHWIADTAATCSLADAKARADFEAPDAFIKAKTDSVGRLSIDEVNRVAAKLQSDFGSSASVITEPQYTQYELIPAVKQGSANVVEVKKLAIGDIARFLSLPTQYLFLDGASNYKDSEAAASQAIEAVYPILRRIEQECNRKLVPFSRRGLDRFEFDVSGLYKYGEPGKKADFFLKALQAGMLSVNEIRAIGNKPGVEGGDQLLVSTNLATPQSLVAKSGQAVKPAE